ncbi:MAG: ROK family transcriptional regulator [Spirochaetales bacterium]|jgi:N-acetylglucosamine repressor|nr:ROK family transcriptional regulator [Spirochaetales bacterium]
METRETMDKNGINYLDNTERNKIQVLNAVRDRANATRREVAALSGLSVSTSKRVVDSLQKDGVIIEVGRESATDEPSKRGRKARPLSLNPGFAHAIGLSIRPGMIESCVLDLNGSTISVSNYPVGDNSREIVINEIKRITQETIDRMDNRGGRLLGVGVGIIGVVSAREGVVLYCPSLPGWEDTPLKSEIETGFRCDVIIDDSVNCRTLAEKRYGKGRDLSTFLYLHIGHGVGAGLLFDGRIFRGKNGLSGEFGHVTVQENGPLCNCGNRGCLEAIASEEAILGTTKELLESNVYSTLRSIQERKESISLADISLEAECGDKLAAMRINSVGESIGTGTADLINVLDPGEIICGGAVVDALGEGLIDLIKRTVKLRSIHSIAGRTTIYRSSKLENAIARGAATMMIEKYLQNEVLNL